MKPAELLFDTSVYVSYRNAAESLQAGWFSAVVWQELAAGANGRSELQRLAATGAWYHKRGRLLVPEKDAWWQAGQILNHLLSDLSRAHKGRTRPQLAQPKKQSIIRDVLIAVSAKQQGVTVISDNEDFPLIRHYYEFRWRAAADFFA